MTAADSNFRDFMYKETLSESTNPPVRKDEADIFVRLANPNDDFLTGSQIIENEVALKAAQEAGSQRAQQYGCTIQWNGTLGEVYHLGHFVETTEIHGIAWNRDAGRAYALRMDLTVSESLRPVE